VTGEAYQISTYSRRSSSDSYTGGTLVSCTPTQSDFTKTLASKTIQVSVYSMFYLLSSLCSDVIVVYYFSTSGMSHTCLYSPATECHHILTVVLISNPANSRRPSWPGWLGKILRWFVHLKMVTLPSTRCGGQESNLRPEALDYQATHCHVDKLEVNTSEYGPVCLLLLGIF